MMAFEISCQTCCDWNKETFHERGESGGGDIIDAEELQDSAEAGCLRCGVLQDILFHFWPLWRKAVDNGYDSVPRLESLFVAFDSYSGRQRDDYEQVYETRAYAHWEKHLDGGTQMPETISLDVFLKEDISSISSDTSCTRSTEIGIHWLKTCLSNHETCGHKPTRLPKRVIDVTPCRRKGFPQLLETGKSAQGPESSGYACLSHCWGKQPVIRTENRSLDQHKKGIPWQALSSTFKDAISITLDFGIDYIWIDSLCIVQDDERDWQEQSGQMASIFENCLFTIAATASADGSGRTPGQNYSPQVKFTRSNSSGEIFSAYARKTIQHPDNEVHSSTGFEIEAPLIDRAWAFQEHILAPRLLQYTATEIMWECNESLTCECGRVDPDRYQRKRPAPRATNSIEDATVFAEWRQTVRSYTMRSLTYPSDKLPALSGLARRTQQRLLPGTNGHSNDTYLAGLWERELLTGLGWIAIGDPIDWSRATPYRAPTWSWASVEGPIGWEGSPEIDTEREPVSRILHASCDLAGPDTTGAVVGGRVILSALAIRVTVTNYDHSKYRSKEQLRHFISYVGPSTDDVESFRDERNWMIDSDYQWADPGEHYIAPGENLTCLRLGWLHKSDERGDLERILLLRPSKQVKGAFERVGATLTRDDDPLRLWFEDAEEMQVTIL